MMRVRRHLTLSPAARSAREAINSARHSVIESSARYPLPAFGQFNYSFRCSSAFHLFAAAEDTAISSRAAALDPLQMKLMNVIADHDFISTIAPRTASRAR